MLHLWPRLHREPGPFVWSAFACGSCVPDFGSRMGRTFRTGLQTETVSRIRRSEWDSFSGRGLKWKVCPGIWLQPGMHFPVEASSGKCIPVFRFRVGCRSRLNPQAESSSRIDAQSGTRFPDRTSAETASQFERLFRDAVSAGRFNRKVCPVLGLDSGTRFPLGMPYGKRTPF